jgi:hypothetical protein
MADEPTIGDLFRRLDLPAQRPAPEMPVALMAAAGAIAAIGALALAGDVRGDSRGAAVAVAAILVAAGYGVLALVTAAQPAGVVLVAAGLGALPPFLLVDDATSSFAGPLGLMTLLWAGAWAVVPLTQGRPFLLGLALSGAWLLVLDLADDEVALSPVAGVGGSQNSAFYLSLVVGVGLLAGAWGLDRSGRPGVATPFVAVGDLAAVVGAIGVAGDLGDSGGSILVIATGVVLGLVGHRGGRRLTIWLGAAVAAGGVIGLVAAVVGDDAETTTAGLALVVAGVALAAVLIAVDQRRPSPTTALGPVAPTAPPTEAPTAPALRGAWHPDPTGRHDYRWWDGERWTDQVASADGRRGSDPPT